MSQKTILIIDPIHSASYLSKKLKEHDIRTIALFSDMSNIAEFNRPPEHLFDRQIHIKDETVNEILQLIGEHVDFVLNGCDQHVGFCEKIAFSLTPSLSNLPHNHLKRGSKFHQQEAMRENGLPHIRQELISRETPDLTKLAQLKYPVFAKPVNGGGSIGIFKATDFHELVEKLKNAPSMVNFDPINEYLVQEFVSGEEIIIDAFSYGGTHTFSHVFTYSKKLINGVPVYRTIETLEDNNLTIKALDFSTKVLDACEYNNGFSHIELFHTPDNEFRLIELNPRISGASGLPNMMAEISGLKSQDNLLAEFLRKGMAESSDFGNKSGFSKALLIYSHEDINFSCCASYISHIEITKEPYTESRSPDLTDLRKIVFIYNEIKIKLEEDAEFILSKDIF